MHRANFARTWRKCNASGLSRGQQECKLKKVKFTATYTVPGTREKVFTLITDPAVLQRCIAGCEKMERTSEDNYNVHLKIGIAGLKGNYAGKVQLQDKQVPESYKLLMEGKGGPGFVK